MKKISLMLIIMALLSAQISILPVHAADNLSGDIYYVVNSDTTSVTITGYTGSGPRDLVIIPSTIDGKTVTAIKNEAFKNKSIRSVILPEGLISIGHGAFVGNLLTELVIPNTVKTIGDSAFYGNKIANLTLNSGVETIGASAFSDNRISNLVIPDNVTEIKAYAFYSNLINHLELPQNLDEIGDSAFRDNKLTMIDFPSGVTKIGAGAFQGNRLSTVEIPSSVTHIYDFAFNYNALSSVTFLGTPTISNRVAFSEQYLNPSNTYLYEWYTDADFTGVWNSVVDAPMTIYASWQQNIVKFDTNGGTALENQSISITFKMSPPTVPTRTGNTFVGWYKEAALATAWNFDTDVVMRDMTLYAKWTSNDYIVGFESNGGTAVANQNIGYNNKVTAPTAPTRTGHTFVGWYKEDSLTTAWNFDTDIVTENTMLYAKWTDDTYSVSFESNGGSLEASQTIVHNGKVTAPSTPVKMGHVFVDWYKDVALTIPWMFTADVVLEDTILYAKWEKESYTVKFDANGGTSTADQEIAFEESVVTPANPIKTGYSFAGWFKDEEFKTIWDFTTDAVITDMTLYAKWTENSNVAVPVITGFSANLLSLNSGGGSTIAVITGNNLIGQTVKVYVDGVEAVTANVSSDTSATANVTLPHNATQTARSHMLTVYLNGVEVTGLAATVTVSAAPQSPVIPTVTYSSNADLAKLNVYTAGKELGLSHAFKPGVTEYTVETDAEQVELQLIAADSKAIVKRLNERLGEKTSVSLALGANVLAITVQAENGAIKTYTVTINRIAHNENTVDACLFSDIENHWAKAAICEAASLGIVVGVNADTFVPNGIVTRMEFAIMLQRTLQINISNESSAMPFSDKDSIPEWARLEMETAVAKGILEGYADGMLRPMQTVNRSEMVAMISRAMKWNAGSTDNPFFSDDASIPAWAKAYVEAAREHGILTGRAGNQFVPNGLTTRAEAAVILLRLSKILH